MRNYQLLLDRMFQVMRDDHAAARWVRQRCRPTAVIDAFNAALFDGSLNTPRGDLIFAHIADRYCATFRDSTLAFDCAGWGTCGRRADPTKRHRMVVVRRSGDRLYVTSSRTGTGLRPGDAIVALDGRDIAALADDLGDALQSAEPTSQEWGIALDAASRCTVEHADGSVLTLRLDGRVETGTAVDAPVPATSGSTSVAPGNRVATLEDTLAGDGVQEGVGLRPGFPCGAGSNTHDGGRLLMKVVDLATPQSLADLVRTHQDALEGAEELVIDLRRVEGDCEEAYFPLLPYLFTSPCNLMDLMGSRKVYTNFSPMNCRRKVEMLHGYRSQIATMGAADAEEALAIIDSLIAEFEARSGEGIVLESEPDIDRFDLDIVPQAGPRKVIVLIDRGCRGAGEHLARLCRRIEATQMPATHVSSRAFAPSTGIWSKMGGRVMLVGRPTLGTTVGSDPVTVALDEDCTFTYPLSVQEGYVDAVCGHGHREDSGVLVHPTVALPWTPDNIVRDLDYTALL